MEHLHYPNETAEYRAARNALLDDEIALRAHIEAVAAKRRALPAGVSMRDPSLATPNIAQAPLA
jgi:predicted dithiol-disulfide oxidoreductase (DUF899 family)